ncbi:TPA: hypothetical protein I8287_005477 [Kluyvera intermedia]|nr:hypothetical protein [Kluyvera intermedia]
MSMTNEQIQALQAAIDAIPVTEWIFCDRQSLSHAGGGFVSINGVEAVWCLNKAVGGMAHSMDVLRYIAAANPSAILSLLAERDADKALIAEQAKRIAELEARTVSVKLPEGYKPHVQKGGTQSTSYRAVMSGKGPWIHRDMLIEACAAAGITLDVGE